MINGILQHLAFGDLLFTLSIILRTCARVVACMHSLLFLLLSNILWYGCARVTGRKATGPQGAGGSKLEVADFFFFLVYSKLKEASFNSVLKAPGSALN